MAKKRTFSDVTNAGNPERAKWVHLACSGSQSERRIRFILPARGLSHIKKSITCRLPNFRHRRIDYGHLHTPSLERLNK